jgi:hypothetical protein
MKKSIEVVVKKTGEMTEYLPVGTYKFRNVKGKPVKMIEMNIKTGYSGSGADKNGFVTLFAIIAVPGTFFCFDGIRNMYGCSLAYDQNYGKKKDAGRYQQL